MLTSAERELAKFLNKDTTTEQEAMLKENPFAWVRVILFLVGYSGIKKQLRVAGLLKGKEA